MTAALRKGWCPSLLNPMEAGDGWLVRVKPSAAMVPARSAVRLADAVAQFGNGLIDLTNRANFQVRGLEPERVEPFARIVMDLGLAVADPAVEQIRNVTASPLGPDDPAASCDAHRIAGLIEAALGRDPRLTMLPPKFGFAVDGGGTLPLGGFETDIVFRPHDGRLAVTLGGAPEFALCTADETAAVAHHLAIAFLDLGQRQKALPRRMRDLVAAAGASAVFAAAGLSPAGVVERKAPEHRRQIGLVPYGTDGGGAFGLGLPFGQMDAAMLSALGTLSLRFGDGTLRTTPWRTLLIPGVGREAAADLSAAAAAAGAIVAPGDARLSIVTCAGKPRCRSASVDARADAARLAALGAAGCDLVHLSGCSKGCAHPGPAAATIVGENGRYGIVLDGRAEDPPQIRGLMIEDAAHMLQARLRSDRS